jgi:cytoskeletal protein CcmA (bactofilin family)
MLGRNNAAKPQAQANTSGANYTYLEAGTSIRGDLESKGHVRLDGKLEGNVRAQGNLEVSQGASIAGDVLEVANLILHGEVRANVTAKGKITITKTGRLFGDVKASALDIEAGAVFSGRSEMNASVTGAERPSNALPAPSNPETAAQR